MVTKELAEFDFLPNAAHVDVHTVAALFGCKPPTIWLRVRRGELIAPRHFGAHSRWNVGLLREALKGDRPTLHFTPDRVGSQGVGNMPNSTIGQVDLAACSEVNPPSQTPVHHDKEKGTTRKGGQTGKKPKQ